VYRIPCHNCSDCTYYIGQTGRNYGKRQEEHRKEVESISKQNVHTVRPKEQGGRNEQVGHNRSCSERKSCHKLVRCQNFGKRKTSEDHAGQGVDLDPERTQLHEQRWRVPYSLPTAYDRLLVTCSTSRDHKQLI